jgi:predicted HTH transcriptional regulator
LTAFQWLADYGVAYRRPRLTKPGVPLAAYTEDSIFKAFCLDTGLLGAMAKLDAATETLGDAAFTEFRGTLAEQFVHQHLVAALGADGPLAYWTGRAAEVDFVAQLRRPGRFNGVRAGGRIDCVGTGFDPRTGADGRILMPEGKTLEYRREVSAKTRNLRTLVAFANSAGGALVFGVEDDRSVTGVADSDVEENRVANMIMDSISPKLLPDIERRTVDGKVLLIVNVYPSSRPPHWVSAEGPNNGVYLRLGSSTVRADALQVAELTRRAAGAVYDQLPNPAAAEAGLDQEAIATAFPDHPVKTTERVLGLVVEEQGRRVPTNGGAFLFAKDREAAFYGAYLRCARFRGTIRADIDDQLDLAVPLLEAVGLVEGFLKKHAFRAARFDGWRRLDEWSVPLDILREVVLNSLVHSDYSMIRRSPIRVAFFDDRVEVDNPGWLLPGLTPELMLQGTSRVRNPLIARVFHEAGLTEAWGTGIPRLMAEAARRGLPEPSISELPGIIRVVVPTQHRLFMEGAPPYPSRSEATGFATVDPASGQAPEQKDQARGQAGGQAALQGDQVGDSAGRRPEGGNGGRTPNARSLELLRAALTPVNRAELLATIGLVNKHASFARWAQPLVDAGWLEPTHPNAPRSPKQRYHTTAVGRAALAAATQDALAP